MKIILVNGGIPSICTAAYWLEPIVAEIGEAVVAKASNISQQNFFVLERLRSEISLSEPTPDSITCVFEEGEFEKIRPLLHILNVVYPHDNCLQEYSFPVDWILNQHGFGDFPIGTRSDGKYYPVDLLRQASHPEYRDLTSVRARCRLHESIKCLPSTLVSDPENSFVTLRDFSNQNSFFLFKLIVMFNYIQTKVEKGFFSGRKRRQWKRFEERLLEFIRLRIDPGGYMAGMVLGQVLREEVADLENRVSEESKARVLDAYVGPIKQAIGFLEESRALCKSEHGAEARKILEGLLKLYTQIDEVAQPDEITQSDGDDQIGSTEQINGDDQGKTDAS